MVASRVFTVSMIDQTVVADETLVIIHTASGATTNGESIIILRCGVSQHGTATSQELGIKIGTKASAFGTYTSTTPRPHIAGGAASGITGGTAGAAGTAGTDASAEGAGTFTDIFEEGFNNLNGYLWVPTPEERIIVPRDTAFAMKLHGTPTTLTNWHAFVTYAELN